jgi:hypothetical protein
MSGHRVIAKTALLLTVSLVTATILGCSKGSDLGDDISQPDAPRGPFRVGVGEPWPYNFGGAVCSWVIGAEYRVDWGDCCISDWYWLDEPWLTLEHQWRQPGIYMVRAQARCEDQPHRMSNWSLNLKVVVSSEETVAAPTRVVGPDSLRVGKVGGFLALGAYSTFNHPLEYRFDWGNGSIGEWQETSTDSTAWQAVGTYLVRSQVRCEIHTDLVSGWSPGWKVKVIGTAADEDM